MAGDFFNIIFLFLIIVLIVITFKHPKEILIGIPLGFIKRIFYIKDVNPEDNIEDIIYPSTGKVKVNFEVGEKSLFVLSNRNTIETSLKEFIEYSNINYKLNEFEIAEIEPAIKVKCPSRITFFDFHILVQQLAGINGPKSCYGSFKSIDISYKVFQDGKTLNNLLGYTDENKYFSIYILDDSIEEEYLYLNQKLPVDKIGLKII